MPSHQEKGGEIVIYVKGTKPAAHWYFLYFFQQSILQHESDNNEWEDHTPAGCARAGGAAETAWAYVVHVFSLHGPGETSATKTAFARISCC